MSTPALVLIGPMGAGKTSVGRRVARELGLRFADTDKVIIRDHGPIPALFLAHGEEHFRQLERAAVRDSLAAGGVVALGGGAVLDADTRAELARHRVALLTVSPDTIAARIGGNARPLLAGDDPVARWTRIFEERLPVYESVADATFDTSTGPLSDVVNRIADWARNDTPPTTPLEAHA